MMKALKFLIGVILILLLLGYMGYIKLPKNWKQVQEGDVEFIDHCFQKEIKGIYSLALLFEQSENAEYESQQLEIYYTLALAKDQCNITGNGEKTGYSLIDTLIERRGAIIPDLRKVIVDGFVEDENLTLNVYFNTKTNNDCKVVALFPFKSRHISVLKGHFSEECGKSTGSAKLTMHEN